IALDDFGTGYSSLSYLWRFPFDKIKIDRAFVVALDDADGNGETVLRAIVGLGRSLGLQVTVEGVETARQLAFLRELRVHQIQGFHFGRPMPAREVAAAIMADYHRASVALPAEAARRAWCRSCSFNACALPSRARSGAPPPTPRAPTAQARRDRRRDDQACANRT